MRFSPREIAIWLAVLLIVLVSASGLSAQAPASSKLSPADATARLFTAISNYQSAAPSNRAAALGALKQVARERQGVLAEAMVSDPSQVLQSSIPSDVSTQLPSGVRDLLEQHVDLEGTLEVVVEDSAAGSKIHYGLQTATKKLTLHFAGAPKQDLMTGSRVRVKGVLVGTTELALDGTATSGSSPSGLTTFSAPLPNTIGAQSTIVILVNFQDLATQPYTPQAAHDVVFNTTSNFDLENSFGQTWLTGDVAGWFTIPVLSTTCDNNAIASYADQAATSAGINLANYAHKVYAFPNDNACAWWGLGTVGGSPSQAWINGSFELKVVAHEMGHNFGLYHSHALNCGTVTLGSSCTTIEYGDTVDDMGNPSAGHFSAFQKQRLGWLASGISPTIVTAQSNGTFTIAPYEIQDASAKSIRILRSTDPTTGKNTWYYVEYRQPIGADTFLSSNSNVLSGVVVHTATDDAGNSNYLLNMAPSLGTFGKPALDVGQTFVDPAAGVTIQTVSTSATGASVSVVFGTPACSHFNPTVSISPYQSPTVQPGTDVTYTVSITNNDNAGCSSSAFNLQAAVTAGWSAQFGSSLVTLAPGASTSTTFDVISPSAAGSGIYTIGVSAVNSSATSFSGTGSASYVLNTTPCVHANPTVSLSPGLSQSVQPGATVTFVIAVLNNDNASCNSSTFALSDSVPAGWTAKLGVSSASLTIAPGAQASTSLAVTSPTNAAGGSYSIGGAASNANFSGFSSATSATYAVSSGSCSHANPTVSMSPAQSAVVAGTSVAYSVTLFNNDSSACSSSSFNLSGTVPAGWTGTFNSATLTAAPGTQASTTFQVASPINTTAGSYTVAVKATSSSASGYSGSASATYLVSSPSQLSLVVSTGSPSYSSSQTVVMTANVSQGGAPLAGVSVTFVLRRSDGSSQTFTSTSGSNGAAVAKYKLRSRDPRGTYTVNASTSVGGVTAQATSSFSVF